MELRARLTNKEVLEIFTTLRHLGSRFDDEPFPEGEASPLLQALDKASVEVERLMVSAGGKVDRKRVEQIIGRAVAAACFPEGEYATGSYATKG